MSKVFEKYVQIELRPVLKKMATAIQQCRTEVSLVYLVQYLIKYHDRVQNMLNVSRKKESM